ncbi:MAG: hypothetical protein JKY56_02940 [Kofleriaceae bacterium]|nr:hypothetical protein [Kofleriaceae bacterium]
MSFRVRISAEAEMDLTSIIDFILVRESFYRAVLVEERIIGVLGQIETMPPLVALFPSSSDKECSSIMSFSLPVARSLSSCRARSSSGCHH